MIKIQPSAVLPAVLLLCVTLFAQVRDTMKIIGYQGTTIRAWELSSIAKFIFYSPSNPISLSIDTLDNGIVGAIEPPFTVISKIVFAVDPNDHCMTSVQRPGMSALANAAAIAYTREGVLLSFRQIRSGDLGATICDALGKPVQTIGARIQRSGPATIAWDCRGRDGRRVSAGVYIIRLSLNGSSFLQRSIIIQ
jgi:hypothetical protein